MHSSCSSLLTDDHIEVTSTLTSKAYDREIYLPNSAIFVISLYENDRCQSQKQISLDTPLISYSLLIRLINRVFHLHSNYNLQSKNKTPIKDDFDLDCCILNSIQENSFRFDLRPYPIEDWCVIEDSLEENFDLIELDENRILVTIKRQREENFLQRATNWFHGSSNTKKCLTKKEFIQMFDSTNGRLLDENHFRQRIYETGCEESIRKIVWCYLLRMFDSYMTNEEKMDYIRRAKDRYLGMKQAWFGKEENGYRTLENLIEKDVRRTDSVVNKRNLSREKLLNIVMTYCVHHETDYAQGMTDMAAPILYVIRDEALAYAGFCTLMRYMSSLFDPDGLAISRRLDLFKRTIRAIDGELWKKIEQCDIGNLMFAYRWLLLDCKREFPFKDTLRVFETLWAALPIDRFESYTRSDSDIADLCPASICPDRHPSITSSISNTILSSQCSSERLHSDCSSTDERDSGYLDERMSPASDLHRKPPLTIMSCLPLENWLKDFASIIDQTDDSDMFTIFLCMALLEQNRTSLMQVSTINVDRDDYLGFYFTRLVRQNHAKQALQLARHYHRQYLAFRMRMRQFPLTNN